MDAVCRRCKARTSHRIERKVGSTPTLLGCTTCGEQRSYRRSTARDRRRSPSLPPPAAVGASPEAAWERAMKGARGPAVAYTTAAYYPLGQRLSHVDFGDGVVTAMTSATVCTVMFQCGEKKLLMGASLRAGERQQ
jgi:hypothetical protein